MHKRMALHGHDRATPRPCCAHVAWHAANMPTCKCSGPCRRAAAAAPAAGRAAAARPPAGPPGGCPAATGPPHAQRRAAARASPPSSALAIGQQAVGLKSTFGKYLCLLPTAPDATQLSCADYPAHTGHCASRVVGTAMQVMMTSDKGGPVHRRGAAALRPTW